MTVNCGGYFYDLPPTQIDTQTITARFPLPILVNCFETPNLQTACADLWNNSLCKTDAPFYQLVPEGWQIDLVSNFPDALSDWSAGGLLGWQLSEAQTDWLIRLDVLDCNCEPIDVFGGSLILQSWVGANAANSNPRQFWQAARIDTSLIPVDTFVFAITLQTGGGNSTVYLTEHYRKVCCNETPVFMRGLHPNGSDCKGLWRGENPPVNIFGLYFDPKDELYINGDVVHQGYDISKDNINDNPVSVRSEATINVKSYPVAPYFAEKIANILTAPYIEINGLQTQFSGAFDKNNDGQRMWLPDLDFTLIDCDKDYKC